MIVFGTDGWRARIAEEFTFDAVRVCAQSVAEWVVRSGGADRGVVIGYDRRFASEHFAAAAAEVVAAHDVNVHLSTAAAPTQSFSWATMRRKAKAGIVITASHNPWTDNGFKVKAETGAAAGPGMLQALEATIRPLEGHPEKVRRVPLDEAKRKGRVELFDPAPDYLDHVAKLFDLTPAHVHEVVTFYTLFFQEPKGRHVIAVCHNLSCHLMGAKTIIDHLKQRLGVEPGETTADGRVTLLSVECLCACELAPMMQVDDGYEGVLTPEKVDRILAGLG